VAQARRWWWDCGSDAKGAAATGNQREAIGTGREAIGTGREAATKQEGRAKKRQTVGGCKSSAVPQGGAKTSSEGRVKERQRPGSASRAQPHRAERGGEESVKTGILNQRPRVGLREATMRGQDVRSDFEPWRAFGCRRWEGPGTEVQGGHLPRGSRLSGYIFCRSAMLLGMISPIFSPFWSSFTGRQYQLWCIVAVSNFDPRMALLYT
jgi:hypothetical protein